MKNKAKIIIADDHEVILDGLSSILNAEDNLKVIATAHNGMELLEKSAELNPDLCIVDIDMPVLNGLQASEMLINRHNDFKIIILTMHNEGSILRKAKELGIKGYLLKTCDSEELIFAINEILRGKTYYTGQLLSSGVQDSTTDGNALARIAQLTKRELDIIPLICQGYSNSRIATKLFISPSTVDNHRTNIMRKLGVSNVARLIRFCISNKIV
jgi:DNA-binding NarL/FixJ family response regulator